jgi:glutamate formiminotransferase/formiminotetrahydrofolate cyclodeaminase
MRLVECVPNFSEGRNPAVTDAIAAVITDTEGAWLLDVDPGKATNRTVVTFVADYDRAVEAAFRAIAKAAELIDMRKHQGEHARMGATDVCPFVPVRGVSMDDCVALARALGERVGKELEIPVYLYEYAATREERRNLATIRAGEYEALADKLKDPRWKPDFGPARFNAKSGATVIGARKFLIAYNVNLNTRDARKANDVALEIREAGRNERGPDGKFVRDERGEPVKRPGRLQACKAVGWYIDEYERAQISINLTDFDVTPPHLAFDTVCEEAEKRGLRVTGSELVGLIPLEAMLQAGRHYLERAGSSAGVPEAHVVEAAIQSLGLRELSAFDPVQKIIEYRVAEATPLADMRVCDFADLTSTDAPAPGGGSVAALMGAMAGALAAMVANLTVGKKPYQEAEEEMKAVAVDAQRMKDACLRAIDADTRAFDAVMAAMRMPRGSDEEAAARDAAVQAATQRATDVPLGVLRTCRDALAPIAAVAERGNRNSLSDAGVAALCARAGAHGAYLNVLINLPGVSDADYVASTRAEASRIMEETAARASEIIERVTSALSRAATGE